VADQLADTLINFLNMVSVGVEGGVLDQVSQSPQEYSKPIYTAMVALHDTAVKPVTAIVLSIMFTLTLAQTSAKHEEDNELGVRIVAATMFKIAMVLIAVQSSMKILGAIVGVGTSISKEARNVPISGSGEFQKMGDKFAEQITDMSDMETAIGIVILLLPFLVATIATLIVLVLITLRFMQLYMMIAFASLPIAFLGNEDTKSMGIGYLRSFGATVLSGAVLIIAVKLSQAVSGSMVQFKGTEPETSDGMLGYIAMNFGPMLIGGILLIVVCFTANGVAKKILGEG
jgi:hypothetical protein